MSITIFTDGSSRGNPGSGGWGAIIRTDDEVTELGGREENTTNNRMELSAAINSLVFVSENKVEGPIVVQSDSKYVIQGITEWVSGWQRNGWKTAGKKDVGNRDLWEALAFAVKGLSIQWKYVEGHAGYPGNERCDEIATSCADGRDPGLYQGARKQYPIDLDAKPAAGTKRLSSSAPAYSYLSLVDGVLEKHKTWTECEARVKGVRGAKFKKSVSAVDEAAIIKEWGM
ncbi:MAG TPA: ribonuclease HI [Candidatus Paceibacterota bacterium]|nr:ribonuclease HI [Candidatus Paceibacterota bacterium]